VCAAAQYATIGHRKWNKGAHRWWNSRRGRPMGGARIRSVRVLRRAFLTAAARLRSPGHARNIDVGDRQAARRVATGRAAPVAAARPRRHREVWIAMT
jgi:hypothetical protein